MDCVSGIYKIVHKESGKTYVGLSVNIPNRWRTHKSFVKTNGRRSAIYNAMVKYGLDAFEFSVIEYCDISLLEEREKNWIATLDTVRNGYNLTGGGESNKCVSEETRRKMSESRRGRKQSQEVIDKRAAKLRGKKRTPEQNAAKSALMKGYGTGRKLSEETKEKMRVSQLGKKHTEEAKQKVSNANRGKRFSDEHKKKLSESHTGYKFSDERKAKHSAALKAYWAQRKASELNG